jgi:15-cis-phytoene synthase
MTVPSPTPSPFNAAHQPEHRRDPAKVLAGSTFSAGILLLPKDLQTDARRLYGLLRTIDDLVDEEDSRAALRVAAIEQWAVGAQANTPETSTLSSLASRYPISRQALIDFCRGMRHDLSRNPLETESDLERYCQDVGGSVGIMLAGIFGTSHPDGQTKMAMLGTAMQWTNILRDIDEDSSRGRIYIARSTIERYGPPLPGARAELLRNQIARADELYRTGLGAIAMLSKGRRAMGLSAILYREILRQIEREGFGSKPGRAVVPPWRKRLLSAQFRMREDGRIL